MSQQNGTTKPSEAPQQVAVRPYRRFIIPSMHRRFTNAALLSLGLCGVQSFWMGQLSSFWQILGVTSIRALLLFISILSIYVLRVANLHVGKRTTASTLHTVYHYIFSFNAIKAFLWYSLSAVFFCEVYIWSSSASAKLSIVDPGKSWERQKLNERPIFLRTMFLCLAGVQSFIHLERDYDRASIPVLKPTTDAESLVLKSQRAFWVPLTELRRGVLPIVQYSFFRAFITTLVAPFIYWLFIRSTVWTWTLTFAKFVFDLPKLSKPPVFPTLVVDLLGRFFVEGFLLVLSWQLANSAFNAYFSLEPLKQGRLLTDESLDPNGSLLNGLKTNRPIPRNFAFWELVLISEHMPTRRHTVYSEISRQGGSTWSQILIVCLGELHATVRRIQTFQGPPPSMVIEQEKQTLHTLPKITAPMQLTDIFKTPSKDTKSHTQSHSAPNSDRLLTSSATKLLTYTADAALSRERQQNLSKDGVMGTLQALATTVLRSHFGAPFRQTFCRRACSIVFTSPHSNLTTIIDAITAISRLIVHSKDEDKLGTVYRDIPNVVRTFSSTHNTIEGFVATLPVHWTDVHFPSASTSATIETDPRRVRDVETVLDALRRGLREIVNEFGEYSAGMGLSAAEMRAAKEIAGKAAAAVEQSRHISGR